MTTALEQSLRTLGDQEKAEIKARYRELLRLEEHSPAQIEELHLLTQQLGKRPEDVTLDLNTVAAAHALQQQIEHGKSVREASHVARVAVTESMEATRGAVATLWEKHKQIANDSLALDGQVAQGQNARGELSRIVAANPDLF